MAGRLMPALFVLLWSSGFTFVALGLPHSEPITFLALRYVIVVAVLAVAFAVVRPPLPRGRAASLDAGVYWAWRPPTARTMAGTQSIGGGSASIWRPPWLDTRMPSAPSATAFSASSGCSSPFRISGFCHRSR